MGSFSKLPEDIFSDILSRLPAKSVGMCRCVSKAWKALLTRHEFIRAHLHMSKLSLRQSLTFISDDTYFTQLMVSPCLTDARNLFDKMTMLTFADLVYDWSDICASADGLVLAFHECDKEFLLNPITREIREVPRWPEYNSSMNITYGIGYDTIHDDYKIVAIFYWEWDQNDDEVKSDETFADVFSVKNGSWKRIQCCPLDHSSHEDMGLVSGVFIDGRIHWLAERVITVDGEVERTTTIEAFDLAEEKFYELAPPCLIDRISLFRLVVLDEFLCLYNVIDQSSNHTEMCVWVMKEYGVQESWTKFVIKGAASCSEMRVLCSLGEGEIVLLRDDDKLALYSVKEAALKNFTPGDGCISAYVVESFVESLVSPYLRR